MVEPEKPFACTLPDCGMTFTNEDHLHVHTKKHDMVLQLGLEQKAAFVADQTPTPTRFIRNCEEVGLFQDLQNVNPFDEGFKRAMETKHCILSLENAIASTVPDDVLHTPQMVFPHIDGTDSTLFSTTNNQRNITISRSSSDESGTIKEYETTTISKLTNEVTTISRVVGNKDILDKITDEVTVKNTDIVNKESVETVSFKNNVIKIHSNVEIRKDTSDTKAPVLIYSDSIVKDSSVVTKDVLLTDTKLQVPEQVPPIMSQKSIDFVVDSLTSELNPSEAIEKSKNVVKLKNDCDIKNNDKKSTKTFLSDNKSAKLSKKCIKKAKVETKDMIDDDYEVIIKLPSGKQVRMKAVQESKPEVKEDTKELLRKSLTNKMKPQNSSIPKNTSVIQNVVQIPAGTLIPITLINPIGNSVINNLAKIPITTIKPVSVINTIPINSIHSKKVTSPVKIANIAPKNPKCPPPFSEVKISPPYKLKDKKIEQTNRTEINIDLTECDSPDEAQDNAKDGIESRIEVIPAGNLLDKTQDRISEDGCDSEAAKRTRFDLDCRSAASKRYRDRLKLTMQRQVEENRQLREANQRLVAEKAALKLLIMEHMKCCPNADDLRIIQERIQTTSM